VDTDRRYSHDSRLLFLLKKKKTCYQYRAAAIVKNPKLKATTVVGLQQRRKFPNRGIELPERAKSDESIE
jgi:hypothetical protein